MANIQLLATPPADDHIAIAWLLVVLYIVGLFCDTNYFKLVANNNLWSRRTNRRRRQDQ